MKQANTNNHDKDGQNILYGDGHVAWESNPFVGTNRDNIYTAVSSTNQTQWTNQPTYGPVRRERQRPGAERRADLVIA
jgi:prepilin-type processing-associated H-X9-DG protein